MRFAFEKTKIRQNKNKPVSVMIDSEPIHEQQKCTQTVIDLRRSAFDFFKKPTEICEHRYIFTNQYHAKL